MKKGSKMTLEQRKKASESHKGQASWNKGKVFSEEAKRKMSEAHKGKHHSPKTQFKKGDTPWHKGKRGVYSSEQLKRMSEGRKGIPAWNKGISPSKETIEKQRDSIKKITANPEYRKQMSEKFKKAWSDPELRKKQSEAIKKYFSNPEVRKKMSEAHKGQISWNKGKKGVMPEPWNKGKKLGKNPEHSIRMKGKRLSSKTEFKKGLMPWNKGKKGMPSPMKGKKTGKPSPNKGKSYSLEKRKKLSDIHKEKMSNPEYRKVVIDRNRAQILKKYESGAFPKQENTKPEREMKAELIKLGYKEGIDFIHQYKFMNKFMCDFCFPQKKVVIEVDGDFWHANPKKYPELSILHKHQLKGIGRDKSKTAYITKIDGGSWTLLRFWESDIKKDVSKCVHKIEATLKKEKIG